MWPPESPATRPLRASQRPPPSQGPRPRQLPNLSSPPRARPPGRPHTLPRAAGLMSPLRAGPRPASAAARHRRRPTAHHMAISELRAPLSLSTRLRSALAWAGVGRYGCASCTTACDICACVWPCAGFLQDVGSASHPHGDAPPFSELRFWPWGRCSRSRRHPADRVGTSKNRLRGPSRSQKNELLAPFFGLVSVHRTSGRQWATPLTEIK